MKKILISGATGYIGRRLKALLLGHTDLSVRLFVRNRNKVRPLTRKLVEIIEGDTFHKEALLKALDGVDTAYYLIHSMGAGKDFEERDRLSATNFREACIESGVKRIIYLGGLGVKETASKHLLSRIETGEILSAKPDKVQTIWFRAGVIIGSGSASFEIIRNLVEKLPVMVTPKWVNTTSQAIAVEDVLAYLAGAIDLEFDGNLVVDIGTQPMTFKVMLKEAAKAMGLRRVIIPISLLTPRLSSYWLSLITPVPYQIASALVEGLKSETVVLNDHAKRYFPHITPMTYDRGVLSALEEMELNQVVSRWCDSSAGEVCDIKDQDDPASAILWDRREVQLGVLAPEKVFKVITSLGGESGWTAYNILWQIRGVIDKICGGSGLSRGRRVTGRLRVGDALDFWKVADIRENKRLLLLAQMKLPGKAWLEFDIQKDRLVQTAHFHPRGLLGRLYWYSVWPFHHLVFGSLIKRIMERAVLVEYKDSSIARRH